MAGLDIPALTARRVAVAGSALAAALTLHTAYNITRLRRPRRAPARAHETVCVLLPLRDEANRVAPTLRDLLAQNGIDDLRIVILDDGSTDGTADVVRALVAGDPRVTLIDGGSQPPPAGWLGKPWACARLADTPDAAEATALVFVDADVQLRPDAVAATVELLRSAHLDLVSPYPRQLAVRPAERLVQPLVVWSWLTTLPLGPTENSPRPSLAAANGQLLAVDAAAYRASGGHGAVRGEVLEDIALLRSFKRKGFRGCPADGSDVAACRMYDGTDEVVAGYAKSLWSAFGSAPGAAAVVATLCIAYVLPPAMAVVARDRRTRAIALAGYAAGVTGRVLVARRTGERWWPDAIAHPVSVAAFALLTAESFRRRRRGTLTWKGRPVR